MKISVRTQTGGGGCMYMYICSCNLSIYMYTGWIRWWSSQNSIMRMCFERLLLSSCCCSSSLWVSHGYLAIFLVHLIQWWTQIRLKQRVFLYCYSYKNVSKTDIKCSWLKHPKSQPKKVETIEEMYPSSDPTYR